MTDPAPARTAFDPATDLPKLNAVFTGAQVVRCKQHDYDQSLELFFAPATPAGWMPTEAQLKAVCALGFVTIYCDFADDTEFVGCWRTRIQDGRKVPDGDYWVMSPRREKVGYPRYHAGG